jgi:hypothetical protein
VFILLVGADCWGVETVRIFYTLDNLGERGYMKQWVMLCGMDDASSNASGIPRHGKPQPTIEGEDNEQRTKKDCERWRIIQQAFAVHGKRTGR